MCVGGDFLLCPRNSGQFYSCVVWAVTKLSILIDIRIPVEACSFYLGSNYQGQQAYGHSFFLKLPYMAGGFGQRFFSGVDFGD